MTEVKDRAAWAEAFAAAQAELPPIPKNKTVDTGVYSYKYADLPDVLEACRPILNKHGLTITQSVGGTAGEIAVTTRIFHTAGHVEEFGPTTLKAAGDAKSSGSAVTYARRYSLTAALGIAPDEDDDGRAASAPQAPVFSLKDFIAAEVAQFTKWDEDRRRMEWKEATKDRVTDQAEAEAVIERMAVAYAAEFPPEVEGQAALEVEA